MVIYLYVLQNVFPNIFTSPHLLKDIIFNTSTSHEQFYILVKFKVFANLFDCNIEVITASVKALLLKLRKLISR